MTGYEGTHRRYDTAVFEKRRLDNGIPVWLQRSPIVLAEGGILTAFLPGVGSQLDPMGQYGLAHFFEHIPFRGTANKPSDELLVRPVTMHGGRVHAAFTTQDFTTYSVVDLTRDSFDLAAETLYEIVANPKIDEKDVLVERDAILNERKRAFAKDAIVRADIFLRAHYGPDHPLGHIPIGDEAAIMGMTAERLRAFHEQYYHAGNIHLLVGCAFSDMKDAVERLNATFGKLPYAEPASPAVDRYGFYRRPGEVEVVEPRSGRDYMFFRYPLPRGKPSHPLAAAPSLARVLAEDLDSPLVRELRLKRGMVYEAGLCQVNDRRDYLEFNVQFPVTAENFALAQEIFFQTLRELEPQTVIDKLARWQLHRRTEFEAPEVACWNLPGEVASWGRPFSFREAECYQDEVSLGEIFAWRNHLLKAEPYIVKIRAG